MCVCVKDSLPAATQPYIHLEKVLDYNSRHARGIVCASTAAILGPQGNMCLVVIKTQRLTMLKTPTLPEFTADPEDNISGPAKKGTKQNLKPTVPVRRGSINEKSWRRDRLVTIPRATLDVAPNTEVA